MVRTLRGAGCGWIGGAEPGAVASAAANALVDGRIDCGAAAATPHLGTQEDRGGLKAAREERSAGLEHGGGDIEAARDGGSAEKKTRIF